MPHRSSSIFYFYLILPEIENVSSYRLEIQNISFLLNSSSIQLKTGRLV